MLTFATFSVIVKSSQMFVQSSSGWSLLGENMDPCAHRLWCFAAPLHSSSEALFWVPVWSLAWPDSSAQKFSTPQSTIHLHPPIKWFYTCSFALIFCSDHVFTEYRFISIHILYAHFILPGSTKRTCYFISFNIYFSVEKCIFFHHFTIVVVTILSETPKYEFDVKMLQQQSFNLTISASLWTRGVHAAPAVARACGSARWEL